MASTRNPSSDLYECDYYGWIQDQVRALRERRFEDVDWDNVAEEIEDLGKSEKRSVKSQIATIVEHLLKIVYAQGIFRDYNARGWRLSVRAARVRLGELLKENPSLQPQLEAMLVGAYEDGRIQALREPALIEDTLPATCPWTLGQLMDNSFLP